MEDRRTLRLVMLAGESRQLLVESGSIVLAIDGRVELHGMPQWLAEQCRQARQVLHPEETWAMAQDGWITIVARQNAQVAVIAPDCTGFWSRVAYRLGQLARRESCPGALPGGNLPGAQELNE